MTDDAGQVPGSRDAGPALGQQTPGYGSLSQSPLPRLGVRRGSHVIRASRPPRPVRDRVATRSTGSNGQRIHPPVDDVPTDEQSVRHDRQVRASLLDGPVDPAVFAIHDSPRSWRLDARRRRAVDPDVRIVTPLRARVRGQRQGRDGVSGARTATSSGSRGPRPGQRARTEPPCFGQPVEVVVDSRRAGTSPSSPAWTRRSHGFERIPTSKPAARSHARRSTGGDVDRIPGRSARRLRIASARGVTPAIPPGLHADVQGRHRLLDVRR